MKKLPSNVMQKNFGHCIVQWTVRNFSLVTCRERFVVRCPPFKIHGPEVTDWKMELETTSNEDGCVLLHLKRLDHGPKVVWVNWRVILKDYNGKSYVDHECQSIFQRNFSYGIDLESIKGVLERLPFHEMDTLEFTCQIIVKHELSVSRLLNKTVDFGLKSLSHDLRLMLSRGTYYDVVLRIDNKDIRAHKSILTVRNLVLKTLISKAEPSKIVTLSDIDAEATEAIIIYLYTGDLYYILSNPSIALHNCIEYFEVEELRSYFIPDLVHITAKITPQEKCFRWTIPNFSKIQENCIRSHILRRSGMNSTWRLQIYPYGQNHCSEVMSIYAEIISSTMCQTVCVEFALLDSFSEVCSMRMVLGQTVAGEWIGVENFFNRYFLKDVLRDNELRIVFKIRLLKDDSCSASQTSQNSGSKVISTEPHFNILSENMICIFKSILFKDIVLKGKKAEFLAHKCILAARSKTFAKILGSISDKIETCMDDDILKIFLNYIYSGLLGNPELDSLFRLYVVAQEYSIPALKSDCCKCLMSKLSLENVSEIILFAEDMQEEELKNASLQIISTYKNDIIVDSKWKNLLQSGSTIIKQVEEYLALPVQIV